MKFTRIFIPIIALVFLAGCWQSKSVDVTVHQQITIDGKALDEAIANNDKIPAFNQAITLSGIEFETETDQAKKDTTNIPVGYGGGQANIESETENAAATQDNSLKDSANTDNRKTDSDNDVNSETTNNSNYDVASETAEAELAEETEAIPDNDDVAYQTKFHHTQTNGTDGGQSLVLCDDQDLMFDSCTAGDVNIPYHGKDEGRLSYWNMAEYSLEDIVCLKDGVKYKYPVAQGMVNGDC